MLRGNEAFSFDLKILSKDIEERNFEMIRAEHWHKHQRPAEDLAFDALVSLVTDPYEVCFEMIHMVHYVNKRVHQTVFEAWDPPYLFAEFWIQKQSQLAAITNKPRDERPAKPSVGYRHQSTQVDLVEPVVRQSAPVSHEKKLVESSPVVDVHHRAIPGFRSILQCGANTLYGDSAFLGVTTAASTAVTPTTARINQLFQGNTAGFTRYHIPESPATTEVTISRSVSVENTSVAERIHRMFQEISTTDRNMLRSDDAENEPPRTVQDQQKDGIEQNSESGPAVTQHDKWGPEPDVLVAKGAPQTSSRFSIFYDPLGLETSVQVPVTTESSSSSVTEPHPSVSHSSISAVVQPSSRAQLIPRPIEVQISSRDPRLRAKQALAVTSAALSPAPQPAPLPSGIGLFDWFEGNRIIADQDESVVAARNSFACSSPTSFFHRLAGRYLDRPSK